MATFRVLADFTGTNGNDPEAGLAIDSSGNLFGTTTSGGANSYGTIFEISANNPTTINDLASFSASDAVPTATLLLDGAGDLYGTTSGFSFVGSSAATANSTDFELAKGSSTIRTVATLDSGSVAGGAYLDTSNQDLVALEVYGTSGNGAITTNATTTGAPRNIVQFSGGSASIPVQVDPLVKVGANVYGTAYGDGTTTSQERFSPIIICQHLRPYQRLQCSILRLLVTQVKRG